MGMIITRADWGAKKPTKPIHYVSPKERTEFFVHYDGAHPVYLSTLQGLKSHMRGMQRFHQSPERDWSDIGYGELVASAPGYDIDGQLVEGRGRHAVGAHCKNHNRSAFSVQIMVGGTQQPSAKALNAVRDLYDECCEAAGRKLLMRGHRDGFATACPGTQIYEWVRAGMPRQGAAKVPQPKPDFDPWVRQGRPEDGIWDIFDSIQLYMCLRKIDHMARVSNLSVINGLRAEFKLPPVDEAVYGRDLVRMMQRWAGRLDENGTLDGDTARRVTSVMNNEFTKKK